MKNIVELLVEREDGKEIQGYEKEIALDAFNFKFKH